MTHSMTGYGVSSMELNKLNIQAEIKSLNSKYLDVSIKLPKAFADKELIIRKIAGEMLERGKVSISIDCQTNGNVSSTSTSINEDLFNLYYKKLSELSKKVGAKDQDIFKLALQSPDVIGSSDTQDWEECWPQVLDLVKTAINKCLAQRLQEGQALKTELIDYISQIRNLLVEAQEYDPTRLKKVRERLEKKINDLQLEENFDVNRFEQELIYYVEKLDIEEEKVRLKNHLDYFEEVLKTDNAKGKKLGFVSQEIGREINTMGSKANDSTLQKIVVNMKEELEKIKEQVLNIL